MELERAMQIATRLLLQLEPVMERVSIAGSVRRKKADVGDIEIVAVPRLAGRDLFEQPVYFDIDPGILGRPIKSGPKYKQIELPDGINLDLFLVTPPAQWGVIFALRTGPAEFSKALVTARKWGGLLPSWAKVKDGAVWGHDGIIEMPEESSFLLFCGVDGLNPEYREAFISKEWSKR